MNKEEPYREQAERLKQRIQKINEHLDEKVEAAELLPPREQLHRTKKQKMRWKLKYPVIRLLVLFFILLPVIIFSVISYADGKKVVRTEKTTGGSVETINLQDSKVEENKLPEEEQKEDTEENKETNKENEKADESSMAPPPEEQVSGTETAAGDEGGSQAATPVSSDGNAAGQTVDKASQPSTANSQPKTAAKTAKIVYHTVQPKETLFRIAMKYYNSQAGMDIIRKANHIQGDQINAGQVLKIPLNN